jgi:hypothetical protein
MIIYLFNIVAIFFKYWDMQFLYYAQNGDFVANIRILFIKGNILYTEGIINGMNVVVTLVMKNYIMFSDFYLII